MSSISTEYFETDAPDELVDFVLAAGIAEEEQETEAEANAGDDAEEEEGHINRRRTTRRRRRIRLVPVGVRIDE